MKKQILLLMAVVCLSTSASFAQKIAAGAHVGFSKLTGDLGGGGLNWILDAKYFLSDKLAVGAEYNSSGMIATDGGGLLDAGIFSGKLFVAKAEYYFTDKKVSPYAGLGLGYSRISAPEYSITSGGNTTTYPEIPKNNFGISPRLGVKLGNFGVEFQYNIAGKSAVESGPTYGGKKFNFWTLNLGYVYTLDLRK